jgi:hypothetical protein
MTVRMASAASARFMSTLPDSLSANTLAAADGNDSVLLPGCDADWPALRSSSPAGSPVEVMKQRSRAAWSVIVPARLLYLPFIERKTASGRLCHQHAGI